MIIGIIITNCNKIEIHLNLNGTVPIKQGLLGSMWIYCTLCIAHLHGDEPIKVGLGQV